MSSLVLEFPGATWRSLSGLATAMLQREIVARERIWKCMIAIICRFAELMTEKRQCPHLKERYLYSRKEERVGLDRLEDLEPI